jgi:hypothetical protein
LDLTVLLQLAHRFFGDTALAAPPLKTVAAEVVVVVHLALVDPYLLNYILTNQVSKALSTILTELLAADNRACL